MSLHERRYEIMDPQAVNPLLLCEICERPLVDPVVNDDGSFGCQLCLEPISTSVKLITEPIVLGMLNTIPVRCSKCGVENILRGNFKKHEQEECRRAFVHCPAADIKCPWDGPRESLDQHKAVCVYWPIRPALLEIITENKQLKERLEKLEHIVNELKSKK